MPSQQNTYRKLDRDTALNKVDKESMYDCRNLRLLGSNPNESGALVNVLGNEQLQNSFSGYVNDTVIGSVQLRNLTILITTDSSSTAPSGTDGRIWKYDFKNWSAPVLIYNGILNLSKAYPILDNIVSRYESAEIQKIYWADGYNKLRYANIADPNIGTWDPDDFNIVNEVDFEAPVMEQIYSGNIPVGRIQYSYRLYKKYGPQTIFAPASKMINLTTENENASNTSRYGGADRLDEDGNTQSSGKAIKMSISNIDQNFDKIEIVAIHYSDINESPNIWIVQTTDVDDAIIFTDSGIYEQGFYSLSEYIALSNLFVPKSIATKNNIMFAADIQTEEFDVAYDARAYRYQPAGVAWLHDSGGGSYYITGPSSIANYGGAPPAATLADIPETFDCFQNGNDITLDQAAYFDQWQSAGSGGTRGGEGVNVKYEFKTTDYFIDNSGDNNTFHVNGAPVPYYWESDASPYNSGYKVGYQRDEIYRFGIVFFSKQGQPSPVKWIGDIRFPRADFLVGATDARQTSTVGGDTYGTRLWLEFTVNNIPTEAVGFQIVRVERKAQDRTVIFQGKMSFLGDIRYSTNHYPSRPDDATAGEYDAIRLASSTLNNRIRNLWVSAPEVSFYKDYKVASGDYVEAIGYFNNKDKTSYGPSGWHSVNKYKWFSPLEHSIHYVRNVNEGYTMEAPATPDEEEKYYSIAGIPFTNQMRNGWGIFQQQGDAGTAAIINLESAFYLYGLPSSSWPVINYRRPVVQYGGNTYEARLGNKYIPASEYIPKTGSNMVEHCYGGDCFIQFFDHLHGFYNKHYDEDEGYLSAAFVDMFPVESTINMDLRHDDCWHRIANAGDEKYYIREKNNASFTISNDVVNPGWTDYYLYNTVFSRMENARQYIPVPYDYDLNQHNDALVMASNAKLNNEEIDSWSIWVSNETLPLDGGFGAIKYLIPWNNILLFFQETGFGTLAVLERSLIKDSEGRNLSLGEGDVLQRYDMISTEIGCSTRNSLIVTPSGIIWFDNKSRRMHRLTKSVENLGILKGMNSYFKSISDDVGEYDNALLSPYTGFAMGYNALFNEVWFSVKASSVSGETLVFNEILDNFTHFIDNRYAAYYINQDDIFISQRINGYLYKENSEAEVRGRFCAEIQDATVEIIVNATGILTHKLTNIELTTEVYNNAGDNLLDETLTSIQITNDYQDTGVLALVPGTNIRRLLRTWRMNALRDTNNNARLRDTYHKVKLTFTNTVSNRRKVVIHDLLSVYEIQNEAIVNKQ